MIAALTRLIARQSPEELVRQHALLANGLPIRVFMTSLAYLVSAIYVPIWIVLACATVDFWSELRGIRLMRGLDPARDPTAYLGTIAVLVLSEAAYTLNVAVAFQQDGPMAKAFAVGVLTLTMLQLGSVRVIHKPYAEIGLLTSFLIALGATIYHWHGKNDPVGFVLTQVCLWSAAYFILEIIRSNHELHTNMAQDRAAAEAADRTKSQFLAQMSHELRTPLNAVLGLGHAELALATTPASQERLGLIVDAARNLGLILDDILDLSAIQAGRLPIRPTAADVTEVVAAAAALYRPLFEARGLKLELRFDSALPEAALFDPQRLRQCLSNLLSNAIKHTSKGGASVVAQCGPDGLLSIKVSDTGAGIPADMAGRIFEPFQRGSGVEGGSGLGLSITRSLARLMGGDLVLDPSEVGACFVLTLPLQTAENPLDGAPPVETPALPADPHRFRVLVVDDIATNRLVALAHLRLLGLHGEEAASGAEAIEMILRDPPDLVFLDMNMPDMDGPSTLRGIRILPSRAARLPVIAMTADATADHRRKYLAAGMDDYLAKPLTPEAVRAVLARHLGKG